MGLKEQIEDELLECKKVIEEKSKKMATLNKVWELLNEEVSPDLPKVKRDIVADIPDYNEYPIRDLFNKIEHLIRKEKRLLRLSEIETAIINIEGDAKAKKTLKNMSADFKKFIKEGRVYGVKFGNSKMYTFYGTDQDWLDKSHPGQIKLFNEYYPPAHIMAHIKRPNLIVVTNNYRE